MSPNQDKEKPIRRSLNKKRKSFFIAYLTSEIKLLIKIREQQKDTITT
jgi:hypothetical protein